MQRPNYPVYGPRTRFDPTRLLADRIAALGITMPDVLTVVPSETLQSGNRPNQWWHFGEVGGRRFKVLVEHRTAEYARMIIIVELV